MPETPAETDERSSLRDDHGWRVRLAVKIDRPVEGAFSGGAVFYDGALVGITSVSTEVDPQAPDLIGDTYVASLWPLILRDFEYDGRTVTFGNLFAEASFRHSTTVPSEGEPLALNAAGVGTTTPTIRATRSGSRADRAAHQHAELVGNLSQMVPTQGQPGRQAITIST